MRPSKRLSEELREINFIPNVNNYAEGSCMVNFGNTKVICTASYDNRVPKFITDKSKGWVTAQYGMLPRATHSRNNREAYLGKQSGRTLEIQRLIGRCLRAAVNLRALRDTQIIIDCDVIQADGGTRTAAISGGFVALALCIQNLQKKRLIKTDPILHNVAAVSCGIYRGEAIIDLDYEEDSNIEIDANFVFNSKKEIIEVQASAEENSCSVENLNLMMQMAEKGCEQIIVKQNEILEG